MEAYNAGWLSILPPVIAIILALATKEVFFSLMIGVHLFPSFTLQGYPAA